MTISNPLFYDQTFNNVKNLIKGEYDNCHFNNCNLSGQNLSHFQFIACTFTNCNLSNVSVIDTGFKEITFKECKLMGVQFDTCDIFLLKFVFIDSQLDFSSFYQLDIKNSLFKKCKLQNVDFTETILTNTIFYACNLQTVIFQNTNLENCDFTTSYNYIINPETNKLKKAQFSLNGLPGLLQQYKIKIDF